MWGGFAIFWEFMALTAASKAPGPAGIIFPLFGLPFVLVGLYLIFGRFIVDARIRARTYYGITNDRIIIVSGLFSQEIKSLPLNKVEDVSLSQHSDGTGTITLGSTPYPYHFSGGSSWPGARRYAPPSLEFVSDAREAFDLIRSGQRANPTSR